MHRLLIAIILVVGLASAMPAAAIGTFELGTTLYEKCKHKSKIIRTFCKGYIVGVVDLASEEDFDRAMTKLETDNLSVIDLHKHSSYCVPVGSKVSQIVDVVELQGRTKISQ